MRSKDGAGETCSANLQFGYQVAVTASSNRAVSDPVITRSGAGRLHSLPLGLMTAIVLVTYAFIVWTLPRGFDWTDESFGYTMIASNRMGVGEPWGFHYLLHPLYILTGESVLSFRIVRLGGYVLLSVALVCCARAVVGRLGISIPRSGWAFILLLAQAGTFFVSSDPPRSLGYNELSSWFAQLGVSLIVLSLAWGIPGPSDQRVSRALWPLWAALGAITTLLVFAKVTSGVALGATVALALVIPNPNLRLWKRVVGIGAGTAAVLLLLWVCRYPIGFYFNNVFSVLFDKSAMNAFNHPLSGMFQIYARSLLHTSYALLPLLFLFVLTMSSFRRKARPSGDCAKGGRIDWQSWIPGSLLIVALYFLPSTDISSYLGVSYLGVMVCFIGATGLIGLAILGTNAATMHGSVGKRRSSIALAVAAIVVAPFISAIGTINPIIAQFEFAATLWAVVLGVALVLLAQRGALLRMSARSLPTLIGCVVILMASLAVKANIEKPYGTAPLLSQDTPTSVPELRGLLLTRTDAAWIDWVSAAGVSIGADNIPATAIDSAGALYVFNHSGYANPWLLPSWSGAFSSLRLACTRLPPSDLFVLQPGTLTMDDSSTYQMTKSLAACRINFPGDFRVVDKRPSDDPKLAMTIWRLKSPRPGGPQTEPGH
jgi:hypothetical protein